MNAARERMRQEAEEEEECSRRPNVNATKQGSGREAEEEEELSQ